MNFNWLKRYVPRSLYARSVLILIVPIIGLQLIVATIFIQRHFDGVTRQLTRGVALEIAVITDQVEASGVPSPDTLRFSEKLGLKTEFAPDAKVHVGFDRHWYDISGRVIKDVLETALDREVFVDLISDFRSVDVEVPVSNGALMINVPRQRISASNPHQLIVLMMFAAIILTIISLIFLRNQVRPIRRLAHAAEAFGKGRSEPYRPSGAEEVRRAGTAFLSMRSRIERQIDQRTRMLSGVSHDLRTPLTRMKLALATADTIEDIKDIEHDVNEMEKMLNEFLEFSRGDKVELTRKIDPFQLISELVDDVRRSGTEIELVENRDADPTPTVPMREMAIKRAVQNLIVNAGRYGDHVRVTTSLKPRSLTYMVEDDGPGIAASEREEALKPFSRLEQARTQNLGEGVGLGLAITQDIAGNHGGSLQLERSETLGGLRAVFTLPR